MKFLAQPGMLPNLDQLLNRYGSMHTIREYIYWAITEENTLLHLYKKLKYVLLERTLVAKLLNGKMISGKPFIPKHSVNLARIKLNRVQDLNNLERGKSA